MGISVDLPCSPGLMTIQRDIPAITNLTIAATLLQIGTKTCVRMLISDRALCHNQGKSCFRCSMSILIKPLHEHAITTFCIVR